MPFGGICDCHFIALVSYNLLVTYLKTNKIGSSWDSTVQKMQPHNIYKRLRPGCPQKARSFDMQQYLANLLILDIESNGILL